MIFHVANICRISEGKKLSKILQSLLFPINMQNLLVTRFADYVSCLNQLR